MRIRLIPAGIRSLCPNRQNLLKPCIRSHKTNACLFGQHRPYDRVVTDIAVVFIYTWIMGNPKDPWISCGNRITVIYGNAAARHRLYNRYCTRSRFIPLLCSRRNSSCTTLCHCSDRSGFLILLCDLHDIIVGACPCHITVFCILRRNHSC